MENSNHENANENKRFYIPIDGKFYETSEDIYKTYYSMERRERYLEERSRKKELSLEALVQVEYPIEEKMVDQSISVEEEAITSVMIEKMLKALYILSEEEKWLIQELFFYAKSEREVAIESGIARTTIQSRKNAILAKLKKVIKN